MLHSFIGTFCISNGCSVCLQFQDPLVDRGLQPETLQMFNVQVHLAFSQNLH